MLDVRVTRNAKKIAGGRGIQIERIIIIIIITKTGDQLFLPITVFFSKLYVIIECRHRQEAIFLKQFLFIYLFFFTNGLLILRIY